MNSADEKISAMQIQPMDLVYKADIIYEVSSNSFLKSRFGMSGTSDTASIPKSIKILFDVIIYISEETPIGLLDQLYTTKTILEAIYLTGKFTTYSNDIDVIEYQIIRLMYGEKVYTLHLSEVEDKYPEYLI